MQPDLLAAATADSPPVPAGGVRHAVLFTPTFHREALVSVDLAADGGAVRLRWFEDSLWGALTTREPRLPPHHDAEARLDPARAAAVREQLASLAPALALPDDRRGCDGITLRVAIHEHGADPRRHEAWSPDADMPAHAYFAAVHALALASLTDATALLRLEQIHGYLDLGLPARDRGGYPRRLRIFSRLTSGHEKPLAEFFAVADPSQAVVVDMRNFEGMGTVLYPVFRRFARRPGALAWAVSPIARRQLRDAGITSPMRDSLSDAILLVAAADAARGAPR
ncbi:MAG: hypothetical protein JNL82_41925 [Myxococcales bacterium]|nr:hypothetical protein [Myxococcales bacterium]